jgi:DNA-directed RNA polymerase subunit RPC12/RpoP
MTNIPKELEEGIYIERIELNYCDREDDGSSSFNVIVTHDDVSLGKITLVYEGRNDEEYVLKCIRFGKNINYDLIDINNLSKDTLKKLNLKCNTEFLRSELEKNGYLECEYCENPNPLYLYDVIPTKDSKEKFKDNPYYITNKWFNPRKGATCDHKVPKSKGGDYFKFENMAVSCSNCNSKKGNIDYDTWISKIKKN